MMRMRRRSWRSKMTTPTMRRRRRRSCVESLPATDTRGHPTKKTIT
jgi:hypothetical protein